MQSWNNFTGHPNSQQVYFFKDTNYNKISKGEIAQRHIQTPRSSNVPQQPGRLSGKLEILFSPQVSKLFIFTQFILHINKVSVLWW